MFETRHCHERPRDEAWRGTDGWMDGWMDGLSRVRRMRKVRRDCTLPANVSIDESLASLSVFPLRFTPSFLSSSESRERDRTDENRTLLRSNLRVSITICRAGDKI